MKRKVRWPPMVRAGHASRAAPHSTSSARAVGSCAQRMRSTAGSEGVAWGETASTSATKE
eukprot:2820702-Alexandrium_andersonii.AAC.1